MPNFDYEKYMGRTMDIPNRMLELMAEGNPVYKPRATVQDRYESGYAEPTSPLSHRLPPAMTTHEEAMRLYPNKMPVGDMPRGFYEDGDVYNTPDPVFRGSGTEDDPIEFEISERGRGMLAPPQPRPQQLPSPVPHPYEEMLRRQQVEDEMERMKMFQGMGGMLGR